MASQRKCHPFNNMVDFGLPPMLFSWCWEHAACVSKRCAGLGLVSPKYLCTSWYRWMTCVNSSLIPACWCQYLCGQGREGMASQMKCHPLINMVDFGLPPLSFSQCWEHAACISERCAGLGLVSPKYLHTSWYHWMTCINSSLIPACWWCGVGGRKYWAVSCCELLWDRWCVN